MLVRDVIYILKGGLIPKSLFVVVGLLENVNFFKWAIENGVIRYIESNYATIENDMNTRNSISKRKTVSISDTCSTTTTRKKREELSILASSCIKKETVEVVVKFE